MSDQELEEIHKQHRARMRVYGWAFYVQGCLFVAACLFGTYMAWRDGKLWFVAFGLAMATHMTIQCVALLRALRKTK